MQTPATPALTTPAPTTRASEEALALAIDPVANASFLADYWETGPLFVERREAGRFDHLLSPADVERMICSSGIREPAFRLVRADGRLDSREYTVDLPWSPRPFSGTADVGRVLAELESGATLVLQGLHLSWQPLAVYCRELEGLLGHPIQANAYFTPRKTQGLPVHHDTHDVLVLQVSGNKRWLVHDPVFELPLREQRYRPEVGEPGEPAFDLTLEPGDTLYLPRGWLHEAVASERDSLHLTIGVSVYTWLDAIRAALEECADDIDFRRSVALDRTADSDLLERLEARLEPREVERRQRSKLLHSRRPILDGQLTQLSALDSLTPETLIERRGTVLAELRLDDDAAALAFEGKEVVFPAHAGAELERVFGAQDPFRARELPGSLDEAGRLVLVRRLVREGFLRIIDPQAGS